MSKVKLGIGTVQFGTTYGISNKNGQTPVEEVYKVLRTAENHSIEILDTASAYGESEKVLGSFDLKRFNVISKFMPETDNGSIQDQLQQSLNKLNASKLYGYMAHRPLCVVENPNLWIDLLQVKKIGLVEKIGFSFNIPDELEKVLAIGITPEIVQIPFNYFDHRFEKYFPLLKESGCEIHTRSAFLQGLFFMKNKDLVPFFRLVAPIIKSLQEEYGNKLPNELLNFCLQNEHIDFVIIGVSNASQLEENLNSISFSTNLPQLHMEIPDYILTPSKWKA